MIFFDSKRAALAVCAVVGVCAGAASGGAVLQPAAVTTASPEFQPISNTISQAGLETPYVHLVTDFDSYVPTTSFPGAIETAWDSAGSFPYIASFDLGGWYDIDGFAVWQYNFSSGVREYELYTDDDMDYHNGATQLGGTFTAHDTFASGSIARFEQVQTRYVHFRALNNHGQPNVLQIGEFAFRGVDPIPCEGEVLFSQPPNGVFSWPSDRGSDFITGRIFEQADSVELAQDSAIEHVRFWGLISSTALLDDFEFRVFADDGGKPAASPMQTARFAQKSRGYVNIDSRFLNEYTATLNPGIYLRAGETYWVSIVNDTTSFPSDWWRWTDSLTLDLEHFTREVNGNNVWEDRGGYGLAFELCGTRLGGDDSCPADFNNDGVVDSSDLGDILAAWGACP